MTRSELIERLALVFEWYRGMVAPETGRLAYIYRPVQDAIVADGQPIRDIGTIWDVAILSRFLARSELQPVIERSLDHYTSLLVPHGRAMILDSRRIDATGHVVCGVIKSLRNRITRETSRAS